MITRIVKMTFDDSLINDFLDMFNEKKTLIRHFEGCRYLELLSQSNQPNVLFTVSHWESETALDAYRQSALFAETWALTKTFFSDKPMAWTLNSLVIP